MNGSGLRIASARLAGFALAVSFRWMMGGGEEGSF